MDKALLSALNDVQQATSELEKRLPAAKAALQKMGMSLPVSYSMLRSRMATYVNLPETEAELQKWLQTYARGMRAAAAELRKWEADADDGRPSENAQDRP